MYKYLTKKNIKNTYTFKKNNNNNSWGSFPVLCVALPLTKTPNYNPHTKPNKSLNATKTHPFSTSKPISNSLQSRINHHQPPSTHQLARH